MDTVAEHPRRAGFLRLLAEVDNQAGDPPALSGLDDVDDVDEDVIVELAHRLHRDEDPS